MRRYRIPGSSIIITYVVVASGKTPGGRKAGSIEVGKDANIVISEGDMRTSKVTDALIQGREVDLTDKHKLLNDRFNKKYNLKPTTPAKAF